VIVENHSQSEGVQNETVSVAICQSGWFKMLDHVRNPLITARPIHGTFPAKKGRPTSGDPMKTQTLFSDPLVARSITCAIYRRAAASSRPSLFRQMLGWLHRK